MIKGKEKSINLKNAIGNGKKPLFLSLSDNLLSELNQRSREIIQKRFGLLNGKKETLDKIGRHYGITRERVRQIISEALKNIATKTEDKSFLEAEEKIIFTISQNDGIIKTSEVIEKFNSDGEAEANAIKFFALCSKKIIEAEEKKFFEKIWIISENAILEIKKTLVEAEKIISQEKKLFTDSEITSRLSSVFPHLTSPKTVNFLKASANIKKNKFDKWGMKHWAEIAPKGTRERVHLILKEHKRPLHFVEIAGLIDKFELGKRKAHPQTVHNELIKDERFVLIGRGIYALREWGYFEGTIQEVIKNILEDKKKPLKKEEIIFEVLKIREVKKTTISINLNNSKIFEKKGELYTIKK
ncbi:MAG TPA: sigma factor-like helix-turn-helix DNA-binding protein [Candidatus Moranbacteria bacterium]|nr:sigma factor-like helix-turn-helix DNA-binding protein [Candidatus Moranbacteria bacterium]